MRASLFAAAYLLDLLAGDPHGFPHPVRAFGWCIRKLEKALRPVARHPLGEKTTGTLLAIGLPGLVGGITYILLHVWLSPYPWLQSTAVVLLAYTTLATRSLHREASRVLEGLEAGRIGTARNWLSRIVGRDTDRLTREEMIKATLETMAENLSDGVVAPLFYLAIGGVPLALAFKAASTLDSMVGYKNDRYRHFGWASARLDDGWNYVPARLTLLLIVAAAWILGLDFRQAWKIGIRDGGKYSSPNAGRPQAALAGALQIRLGGPAYYGGVRFDKPFLGEDRSEITPTEYKQTVKIIYVVSGIMAGLVFWLRWILAGL